jgi:hypothetical protein
MLALSKGEITQKVGWKIAESENSVDIRESVVSTLFWYT